MLAVKFSTKTACRLIFGVTLSITVTVLTIWGSMAILHADLSYPSWVRYTLTGLYVMCGFTGCIALRLRRMVLLVPFAFGFLIICGWWYSITPQNDRQWQADVSKLPSAEINGEMVRIRNIRNFKYSTETDFIPYWYDKTVDLKKLNSIDLFAVYWMGDAIAHTIVSFGFEGQRIAFSIETRKEVGESYSTLGGLFRKYELYYVVGDERDLIGLRTTHRNPPEDVYLYRVKAKKEGMRRLFLEYIHQINSLNRQPEFYNTLTTNCTTNIVMHVRAFTDRLPLSWKMLASGYFPELLHDVGALHEELSYAELRTLSLINSKARRAEGSENFSQFIRMGLPGIP